MPVLKTLFTNRNGKNKNRMVVIAYMMATILFILSPDYIYGASTYDMKFVGSTISIRAKEIEEETANEAIVRNDITQQSKETTGDDPFLLLKLSNTNKEYIETFTKGLMFAKESGPVILNPKGEEPNRSESSDKESQPTNFQEESEEPAEETLATTPVVNLSKEDQEILQRIVEAEATGEDIKGKILVANVILNRVNHDNFPDTVKGVVFQKDGSTYQFSPIKDGRYWSVSISKDTITAIERVMAGEDYSQGALYFSARSKADKNSMSWFDRNLDFLFKYGGHEFFK